MKSAMQVKALIRNLSREKGLQAEIVLRNYMLERFLERVSLSKYRSHVILKGGLLISNLIGIEARSTMDLDATIKGISLKKEDLTKILNEIFVSPVDDDVKMALLGFETIRDEADYQGVRISLEATLQRTKQVLKIDITAGDAITPKEIEYSYRLLIENRSISIMAYNTETVLAEKLETILSRSITNTRMRDYYDIYALLTLKSESVNSKIFSLAFKQTAKKRGSYDLLTEKGGENMKAITSNSDMASLWKRYQIKNTYASGIHLRKNIMSPELLLLNSCLIQCFKSTLPATSQLGFKDN